MLRNELKTISSTRADLRSFGRTVGGVLLVIGILLWWRGHAWAPFLVLLGFVLVCAAYVASLLLLPFQKVWMGFAVVMGFVMTRVILFILFMAVLTPLALIARLAGRRFLDTRFRSKNSSYWRRLPSQPFSQTDWERQF